MSLGRNPRPKARLGLPLLLLAVLTSACASRGEGDARPSELETPPPRPQPAPAAEPVVAAEPIAREIPYEGALPPGDPPAAPISAAQKPLAPSVREALDVLYERPSPRGPEPIPVNPSKAIFFEGAGPVIQVLPGRAAFGEKLPPHIRTAMPEEGPYSNRVARLPRGSIRGVGFDRTLNDTKVTRDSMEVEISFTDHEGAEWRIEQVMLAGLSSNPVAEPWFGGLAIDTLYHGDTGNGTPAVPLVNCALCSWAWADIYKDDERVASSALLHIMVTSRVRARAERDFAYDCYKCASNPVREVHVLVPPMFYLPAPGGFLHVMWENVELRRGSAGEIAAAAPALAKDIPTIELAAAPYLRWDRTEIRVVAGRKYRLVVHNQDPSSFHQFSLHSMPESAEQPARPADLRHDHTGTAGRTGPLWRPGDGGHEGHGDPPAPRNVFLTLPQGATWATMVTFEKPGEYEFMCPVTNHYRRGMHGKFIVTAGTEGEGQ